MSGPPTFPVYGNGCCPKCGGEMIGDGYRTLITCENVDRTDHWDKEPDAQPVLCDFVEGAA